MADHRLGLRTFTDEVTDRQLPVEGTIPDWLDGHLVRNGPGTFEAGDRSLDHWFDGFALLRGFEIRDGSVAYTARFLESEAYRRARDDGGLAFPEFGTNPDDGSLRHLLRGLRGVVTDNAVVDVTRIGGELAAVTETNRAVTLDPATLAARETRVADDLDVTGTLAHTHYDFAREETVGLGIDYGREGRYVLYRRPKGATRREAIASLSVERPSYIHSIAVTEQYAVVTEPPYELAPLALLAGSTFAEAFRWRPDGRTRFLVVDRDTGRLVAERHAPPSFVFHHANAYETTVDGDATVVVDCVTFADAGVVGRLYLDRLRTSRVQPPGGELRRYRLSLDTDRVEVETVHPGPLEFPCIDYAGHNGRPYRYVYAVARTDDRPDFLDTVVKLDHDGGTTTWTDGNVYPGEPLFVPAPDRPEGTTEADGAGEDAGVLLSVVLDADAERSFLLVLDATDLSELARARLPHALPFGFHGQFFRDDGVPSPSMG